MRIAHTQLRRTLTGPEVCIDGLPTSFRTSRQAHDRTKSLYWTKVVVQSQDDAARRLFTSVQRVISHKPAWSITTMVIHAFSYTDNRRTTNTCRSTGLCLDDAMERCKGDEEVNK